MSYEMRIVLKKFYYYKEKNLNFKTLEFIRVLFTKNFVKIVD